MNPPISYCQAGILFNICLEKFQKEKGFDLLKLCVAPISKKYSFPGKVTPHRCAQLLMAAAAGEKLITNRGD